MNMSETILIIGYVMFIFIEIALMCIFMTDCFKISASCVNVIS